MSSFKVPGWLARRMGRLTTLCLGLALLSISLMGTPTGSATHTCQKEATLERPGGLVTGTVNATDHTDRFRIDLNEDEVLVVRVQGPETPFGQIQDPGVQVSIEDFLCQATYQTSQDIVPFAPGETMIFNSPATIDWKLSVTADQPTEYTLVYEILPEEPFETAGEAHRTVQDVLDEVDGATAA